MSFVIRQATVADVPGIARVIQAALDDDPDETQIVRALQERGNLTMIAVEEETIAGFASGFLTYNQVWRWELDLLGVLPAFQGQRLGRQLIQACTQTGYTDAFSRNCKPQLARGLVATHNVASQKAFAHAGYTLLSEIMALFVSVGNYPNYTPILVEKTELIPVITLTYRGFWIEGEITQAQTLHAAQVTKTRYGWYSTGAVVPLVDKIACQLLHDNEFTMLGEFQWWEYKYQVGS